jgi:hypothetical protein
MDLNHWALFIHWRGIAKIVHKMSFACDFRLALPQSERKIFEQKLEAEKSLAQGKEFFKVGHHRFVSRHNTERKIGSWHRANEKSIFFRAKKSTTFVQTNIRSAVLLRRLTRFFFLLASV